MAILISFSRLMSVIVLTFGIGTGLTLVPKLGGTFANPPIALAGEDEDEEDEKEEEDDHDEEDEKDDEDDERRSSTAPAPEPVTETAKVKKVPKTKTVIQEIVEETPVIETYVVTDPGYDTDGDSDGLVDALDPDPALHQSAYFTDDDGDSVPNALDTRPGTDDILALDELSDANANGVLDSFESL
jgi:hypothetical protein